MAHIQNYKKTQANTRKNVVTAEKKEIPTISSNAMAFRRLNYILLAVGMAIVVLGFLLMAGGSSTTEAYNPDIFSARRIKVAPMVCLFGFVFMIFAIIYRPKCKDNTEKKAEE